MLSQNAYLVQVHNHNFCAVCSLRFVGAICANGSRLRVKSNYRLNMAVGAQNDLGGQQTFARKMT